MGDEAYWHEGEPRVIRSGRWEQDELGDISYIPDHVRPVLDDDDADPDDGPDHGLSPDPDRSPDPSPDFGQTAGYRVRSDAVWAAARRDYLAGDTAEAVCDRYQLKSGTLRSRAAREGWRRSDMEDDMPDHWPAPHDEDGNPNAAPPDLAQMAAQALMRLDRAVRRGRAAEAASWLRTWRALSSVNLADPALLAALTPASALEPAPDPAATLDADLKAVAEVARDAAALSPHDHAGRRAIEARMAALKARLDPDGKISDRLDELDSVFPGEEPPPPVPSPLVGEGGP